MNKKNIGSGASVIIIMLLIIVGLLTFLLFERKSLFGYNLKRNNNDNISSINIENSGGESLGISCEDGWTGYRQEVIGIEFCYPEDKWGVAEIEYLGDITSLKDLAESYKKQNIYYKGYVEIGFNSQHKLSQQGGPVLKIFDEKYLGEHYKNVKTHHLGYRDNILELKKTGDICQYKIEFNKKWENKGSEKEYYKDCNSSIKISLVEQSNRYDFNNTGWRYKYLLNLFAYKKLKNGYFDNVLIKYNIGSTSQQKSKLNNWEDYFGIAKWNIGNKSAFVTKDKYKESRRDFEKFVESIKIFKPVVEDLTKYKSDSAMSDSNIKLIEKYYWLLTRRDLKGAYLIRSTNESFTNFENQYKNIHFARPYNFKKIGDNEYIFFVEYQDHNSPVKIYQVKTSVASGKVKINFVQMFVTDRIEHGDMVAYGAIRGDKSYVILEKDGREVIIDEGEARYDEKYTNINAVKLFQNVEFSPNGNYLKYVMMGYEWGSGYVYDIQNDKVVVESSRTLDIKFTPDEKYVYYCAGAGMINTREGIVMSVPNFKEEFSVFGKAISGENYPKNNDYFKVVCDYNKDNDEIIFKLSDLDGDMPEKIVKYKLK